MDLKDSKNRLLEANKILLEDSTSAEKLESLSIILKGLNPKLDIALQNCKETFSKIENLQNGDAVSLTAASLPENSEEEKRRKKAILAFIRTWKDLKDEVVRVKTELENSQGTQQQAQSTGKIISLAKGPFGLITIAAVLIVGILAIFNLNKNPQTQVAQNQSTVQSSTAAPVSKIKVIIVNSKKIPLSELKVVTGPECDRASHYHALNSTSAKALDGSVITDPGGCGFGKVSEVSIVETQ